MSETPKTFDQEEVNRIVAERLKQERSKIMREAEQREAAIARREALLDARADWLKRGLPADLLDSLDLSRDGVVDAAASILEGMKTQTAPRAGFIGGRTPKESTPADATRAAFGLGKD